uniref:Type II methyltransferase M.HpaI n=1 Tax=Haemophilus parainfluenzae TaxID=729 RepID=MTH1_HAEPA|nr:RecName: Full=Type II methyltransferase M.HpaI; Short=M.HpaI; AltName: Full=Adenine-specific methyltransferase HpaI; AltName: Full=Modification methylase HpaI [Haemophilus parainfluenzae]BAA01519.1 HpaI methyltransferase [Haemophilus parainfluenzae]
MDQRLICSNAIKALKNLEENSIDLIITDPPYNLGKDYGTTDDNLNFNKYLEFSHEWLEECYRVLKPHGTIYIFMGMKYISYIYKILEQDLGMYFNSWITWYYTQGIGKTRGYSPRHDDILMFTKHPKKFTFNLDRIRVPQKYYRSVNNMRGANPSNVWEFSHVHYCNKNRKPHPTQKPEALYERMILASSNEGDIVLDPFVGSGTLNFVCKHLNRSGIGIDINKEYIEMAKERLDSEFNGFDSIDERMKRCPNDLSDPVIRKQYIINHINWFLKNHENAREEFLNEVKTKYYKKMTQEEKRLLDKENNLSFDFS